MTDSAVVVFSGGQDSTTVLLDLLERRKYKEIHAITFEYGQRHSGEIECAKEIIKQLQAYYGEVIRITHKIVDMNVFNQLTAVNSLTDTNVQIKQKDKQIPNTFVPGRNIVFFTLASVYAKLKEASEVYVGVSEADYSGYPDCREDFVHKLEEAVTLGMDSTVNIVAPLMHLNKKQVWKLAYDIGQLHYIKKNTLTCYNGIIGDGCKECPACELRKRGLQELEEELNNV